MPSMTAALRDRLKVDAAISALVGTRVYRTVRTQGSALPALVVTLVSAGRGYTQDGPMELAGSRVQIDCYGTSAGEVEALGGAVLIEMEQPAEIGEVRFTMAFLDRDTDLSEQTETDFIHRRSMDFFVWWEPAS